MHTNETTCTTHAITITQTGVLKVRVQHTRPHPLLAHDSDCFVASVSLRSVEALDQLQQASGSEWAVMFRPVLVVILCHSEPLAWGPISLCMVRYRHNDYLSHYFLHTFSSLISNCLTMFSFTTSSDLRVTVNFPTISPDPSFSGQY